MNKKEPTLGIRKNRTFNELPDESTEVLDKCFVYQNYNRFPVEFVVGRNDILEDDQGREYIDQLAGIAVTALGHGNQRLAQLAHDQIEKIQHTSNLFYNREQALLARTIVQGTSPGKVFFCNTGTEANEAALKLMRAHGQKIRDSKFKVIALTNSFHGRTFGSMALTGQEKIQKGFGEMLRGVLHVPINNLRELKNAFDRNVCGIILETLQGEGGLTSAEADFVAEARRLATEHDALLCFDEIQTGMGRTGKMFHYEHYGVRPDIVTMAKGLGAGFPIGAVWVGSKFEDVLGHGMHGTTFGGNFLACRIARYVWETIQAPEFLAKVNEKALLYDQGLAEICKSSNLAVEVRGKGLMRGVVLDEKVKAREFAISLLEKGLVVGVAGGNTLRFVPPLTITNENITKSFEIIKKHLKEWKVV